MNLKPGEIYMDACMSDDLAAFITALSASNLKMLHKSAVETMRFNKIQGGIPAVIKWACILEASTRFLS